MLQALRPSQALRAWLDHGSYWSAASLSWPRCSPTTFRAQTPSALAISAGRLLRPQQNSRGRETADLIDASCRALWCAAMTARSVETGSARGGARGIHLLRRSDADTQDGTSLTTVYPEASHPRAPARSSKRTRAGTVSCRFGDRTLRIAGTSTAHAGVSTPARSAALAPWWRPTTGCSIEAVNWNARVIRPTWLKLRP
jgi:hypothetical protein